jgi:hypothetical protein
MTRILQAAVLRGSVRSISPVMRHYGTGRYNPARVPVLAIYSSTYIALYDGGYVYGAVESGPASASMPSRAVRT